MKKIVTEIFRAGFGVTGKKTEQKIDAKWRGFPSQSSAITRIIVTFLAITTFIQVAAGQDAFGKIAATGSPISGIQRETAKSNQSQVVYYQGYWWGIFKNSSDSYWYIYKYNKTGLLSEKILYNSDNKVKTRISFNYNERNRLSETIYFTAAEKTKRKYYFNY